MPHRPYTWLHPNASQKSQIPLAPRAPSIHGPVSTFAAKRHYVSKREQSGLVTDGCERMLLTLKGHRWVIRVPKTVPGLCETHNLSLVTIFAIDPGRSPDFFDVARARSGQEDPLVRLSVVQYTTSDAGATKGTLSLLWRVAPFGARNVIVRSCMLTSVHRSVAKSLRRGPESRLSQWNSRKMGLQSQCFPGFPEGQQAVGGENGF